MPRYNNTNMKDIENFIKQYYLQNGFTPKLSEWKMKDGFPCNKETLLKFGKYNDILKSLGYEVYSYGKRRYNKKDLLNDLRDIVLTVRDINYDSIKKDSRHKGYMVYVNQFGSFDEALRQAGITNNETYLIRKYPEYKLESSSQFLLDRLFEDNIPQEALDLMIKMNKLIEEGVVPIRENMKGKISLHKIRKYFISFTEFLICCGIECSISFKHKYTALDGHICDSYGEAIIDDLLYKNNIEHEVHTLYPNSNYITDFKINDNLYIEYTSSKFMQNNGTYLKHLEDKYKIAKENNIVLLEISDTSEKSINDLLTKLSLEIGIENLVN